MTNILDPRENYQFVGHLGAEKQLLFTLASTRIQHAWLISGPKGIGKATLAYRFARFILVNGATVNKNLNTLAVDQNHPTSRRVAVNSHADLYVVERAILDDGKRMQSIIPVDRIREIGRSMSLSTAEGGWRLIIIDGAEHMNVNATNALLKMLEEPPKQTIFLLISHTPARLPPTIISRCRHMKLSPINSDVLDNFLKDSVPTLSENDRSILVRISDGSIGRALEFATGNGLTLQRELISLMLTFPNIDMEAAHKLANHVIRRDSDDLWHIIVELINHNIADLITTSLGKHNLTELGHARDETPHLPYLKTLGGPDQWVRVWEKNIKLFRMAESINLDRKQVILNALTTMANVSQAGV